MAKVMWTISALLGSFVWTAVAHAQRPLTLESLAGSYRYAAQGIIGQMEISLLPACQVRQELGCVGRTVVAIHLTSTRQNVDGVDCAIDAVEEPSSRIVGPISAMTFVDEDHHRTDIEFRRRQGDVVAQVRSADGAGCSDGNPYAGSWVQDESQLTQRQSPSGPGAFGVRPELAALAAQLPVLQGRWSDGRCASRWNDWSISNLDITFRDQAGGIDVERVVSIEPGGFRTQAVVASRGSAGGFWIYQPLDADTIRVKNVTTGTTFSIHRCPTG